MIKCGNRVFCCHCKNNKYCCCRRYDNCCYDNVNNRKPTLINIVHNLKNMFITRNYPVLHIKYYINFCYRKMNSLVRQYSAIFFVPRKILRHIQNIGWYALKAVSHLMRRRQERGGGGRGVCVCVCVEYC
jgi:hypothetical protein